jgi:hypothetical protein
MSGTGIGNGRKQRGRGPVLLAELVGKAIGPLAARRGFGTADLIAAWPEIVGARFADCTRPDKIAWPRGTANEGKPAHLVVRVHGPAAVLFQHESGQVVERVNAFLGYAAIAQVKIVQGAVAKADQKAPAPPEPIDAEDEAHLGKQLAPVDNDDLRSALDRLGRGILANKPR